ncbi:DUF2441 domain-containing protein [Echinicola salinicaeni]|uniref:DUF2441 domain-containing protein n=1 Tax=Echinicola salinicaeni TaxID=2762757 RepID=UPI001648F02E|nr:DUF2441 domain-containing protein [Echinicola salinicaeni]
MKIENKEFFHLKRSATITKEWELGNKFHWNSRPNNFSKNIFSMDLRFPQVKDKVPYRTAYENLLKLPDSEKNKRLYSYFHFTNFALNKTSMMLREIVLENYRKENCPHLPSRHNAIWICQKEGVEYWKNALQTDNTVTYKIRLNGEMHVASEKSLYSDVQNVNQYLEQAELYWTPNQKWTIDAEGIFDGEIEILEKI